MGLELENYNPLGAKWLFVIITLLCTSSISFGQLSPDVCPIRSSDEPMVTSSSKYGRTFSQNQTMISTAWDIAPSSASVSLDEVGFTYDLIISDFNLNIPPLAEIYGIKVYIDGNLVGNSYITEHVIQLVSDSKRSNNMAHQGVPRSKVWANGDEASSWHYGAANDNWGVDWTAEDFNENFGLQITLLHAANRDLTVFVENVKIEVTYLPAVLACRDNCPIFYVDEKQGIDDYFWHLPEGFSLRTNSLRRDVVAIMATYAEDGPQTICVDGLSNGEVVSSCCREFNLVTCEPGSIGDFVWNDLNANGLQDFGEPGISDVQVNLLDIEGEVIATTLTDQSGRYIFEDIFPGEYAISTSSISGFDYTVANNSDQELNSSITKGDDQSEFFNLNFNEMLTGIDVGFVELITIGDFVWEDCNYNGLQDADEKGIEGVEVILRDANGMVIQVDTSDENGIYSFSGLIPADYSIEATLEEGFMPTLNDMFMSADDSDLTELGNTGILPFVVLRSTNDIDLGLFRQGVIGDKVWLDVNADGFLGVVDENLEGVPVTLTNLQDGTMLMDTTDADGFFLFDPLLPGEYLLEVSVGDELTATIRPQDGNSILNAVGQRLISDTINVKSGQLAIDNDLGLRFIPAKIGGLAFDDLDFDGIFGSNDIGIPEVDVALIDSTGFIVAQTMTDSVGAYCFTDLIPGEYTLNFNTLDSKIFTLQDVGSDDEDSDVNELGETEVITIMPGDTINNVFAGYTANLGKVQGTVFLDSDIDGLLGENDDILSDIKIALISMNGDTVQKMKSKDDGTYCFDGVDIGNYVIAFYALDSLQFTFPNAGDEALDSDVIDNFDIGTTALLSVLVGDTIKGVNAGLVPFGQVGDFVWFDTNKDGIQDATEVGINDISIELYDMSGSLLQSTVSADDADGNPGFYHFDRVRWNNSYIVFGPPLPNTGFTLSNVDPNLGSDVTSSIVDGSTDMLIIMPGTKMTDIDAGYAFEGGGINGVVFEDTNNDSLLTFSDTRLEDVTVDLYRQDGTLVSTTQTGIGGFYQFFPIDPGSYYVVFQKLDKFSFIPSIIGGSDVTESQAEGSSDVIDVMDGVISAVNAGIIKDDAKIQGVVWIDINKNGTQEADEPTFEDIKIYLTDENGMILDSTSTDENGAYIFTPLDEGRYQVAIEIPSVDYGITILDEGFDDTVDSDFRPLIGSTNVIRVDEGECVENVNAGLISVRGKITGFTWIDENVDGLFEPNERFLELSKVYLYQNGVIIDSTFTDDMGSYQFVELPLGVYNIEFIPENTSLAITTPLVGNDPLIDSDVNVMTGLTDDLVILANTCLEGVNGGYGLTFAKVNGIAWDDKDLSGVFDPTAEDVYPDVKVYLISNGVIIDSTTTDAGGRYEFLDLTPMLYTIQFVPPIEGLGVTFINAGSDPILDNDVLNIDGFTREFSLMPMQCLDGINVGYICKGSVAGSFFIDENEDGLMMGSDMGLDGITVFIVDEFGTIVDQTVTSTIGGVMGSYQFDNLSMGAYMVTFELPPNTSLSPGNVGMDNTIDSDFEIDSGGMIFSEAVLIDCGDAVMDVDAGIIVDEPMIIQISGLVWDDDNNDGLRGAGETLLEGIQVQLVDQAGTVVALQQTNANGMYEFAGIPSGMYFLRAILGSGLTATRPNQGMNDALDSDYTNENGNGTSPLLAVNNLAPFINYDLGVADEIVFEGITWLDENNNGLREATELPLEGVTVSVTDIMGEEVASTITSADGTYTISMIPLGFYSLEFTPADMGFYPTARDAGPNDIDSDINNQGSTGILVLTMPGLQEAIDAGYVTGGSIGDRVWVDFNGNGIQNNNEPGVNGVPVELYDENDQLIASTTTAGNMTSGNGGMYNFADLPPANYYVKFIVPDMFLFTRPNFGNDDLDSDVTSSVVTGSTDLIPLGAGEIITNADAGIFIPGELGDFVWNDLNQDGLQDPDEPGLADVVVKLFASNGLQQGETMTDSDGFYSFADLRQGLYFLEFGSLPGFEYTVMDAGSSELNDSDADVSTGRTPLVNLAHGVSFLGVDCGLFESGKVINIPFTDGRYQEEVTSALDNKTITVHPNPSIHNIQVKTELAGSYLLQILDAKGEIKYTEKVTLDVNELYRVDVSYLRASRYFVRLVGESRTFTTAFIKVD